LRRRVSRSKPTVERNKGVKSNVCIAISSV
jgi:hypothetical protein